MKRFTNFKILLLLSTFTLGVAQVSLGAERDEKREVKGAHSKPVSVPSPLRLLLSHARQQEAECSRLLQEEKMKPTALGKISCLQQCLGALSDFFNVYQRLDRSAFSSKDKVGFLEFINTISNKLYVQWTTERHLLTIQEGQASFQAFIFKNMELAQVLVSEMESLQPVDLQRMSPEAFYCNTIVHTTTLFVSCFPAVKAKGVVNEYAKFASQCLTKIQDENTKRKATQHMAAIMSKVEELGRVSQKHVFGKKGRAFVAQKEAERQLSVIESVRQVQPTAKEYDPSLDFETLRRTRDILIAHRDIHDKGSEYYESESFINGHRVAYAKLLHIETETAKKCGLSGNPEAWTVADYLTIYGRLAMTIPSQTLHNEFYCYIAFAINSGNLKGCDIRLKAFAKILGKSGERLDFYPGILQPSYAMLQYLSGRPEVWDSFVTTFKKGREQEKEKKEQVKLERMRREIAVTQTEAAQERDQLESKKEESKAKNKRDVSPQHVLQSSEPPYFAEEHGQESTTVIIKRDAQEALEKMELKKQKKEEKNHEPDESLSGMLSIAPTIPSEAHTASSQVKMEVPGSVLKLYQSLYSLTPKLTSDQAVQLLGGRGLTVSPGRGSHVKCTLNNGETIFNKNGEVIWQCFDMTGLMMVVPQWDGKDIPDYMVKNLKYILNKVGFGNDIESLESKTLNPKSD